MEPSRRKSKVRNKQNVQLGRDCLDGALNTLTSSKSIQLQGGLGKKEHAGQGNQRKTLVRRTQRDIAFQYGKQCVVHPGTKKKGKREDFKKKKGNTDRHGRGLLTGKRKLIKITNRGDLEATTRGELSPRGGDIPAEIFGGKRWRDTIIGG